MTEMTSLDQRQDASRIEAELTWRDVWAQLKGAWSRMGHVGSDPRIMWGALLAILLIAATLRFTGINWDQNQHLHPDERFLTMVENSLKWPKSLAQYFDSSVNPLNPYNHEHGTYVYGLFPVVIAKFLGELTGKTGYDGVYLVGRVMSAVMDMLCILFVFLTGRRLYDARVGLLGALLLALTVLDIQQSHYFTVDTYTAFYATLSLYLAVRVAQGGGRGSVVLLGVAFGLAVSAKISVLSFLLIIVLAYAVRSWAQRTSLLSTTDGTLVDARRRLGRLRVSFSVRSVDGSEPPSTSERVLIQVLGACGSILVIMVVAALVFRVAQPQAFMGPGFFGLKLNPKWTHDMEYASKLVSGEIDYPPSHQWASRPFSYVFQNMVLWGLGLPLGIALCASWALMLYELVRKRDLRHLLPWAWMTLVFVYQSIQFVKPMRYLLPIYPTMALMAGYGLLWLYDKAKGMAVARATTSRPNSGVVPSLVKSCPVEGAALDANGLEPEAREPLGVSTAIQGGERPNRTWMVLASGLRRAAFPSAVGAIAVVVVGTALWAIAFTGVYTRPVSRVTASRWMYQHLPKGTNLTFEQWDDPVPLNVDERIGGAEFKHIQMDLYWDDNPEKREKLYSWLQQADVIAETSNRLYGSIPRLPTRFPMTTRYYEALFSGELGFERIAEFTSRPRIFGIEINDDDADESFTVYDHPKVTLFRKRGDFDMERVRAILGTQDLDRIVRVKPIQVTTVPNNLMLSEDEWAIQRAGGTWSDIFARDSLPNRLPTLTWLVVLELVGLIAFPFGFVAFRRLRDRGFVLAKTLGLLLVGYLSWLFPSIKLLVYSRTEITGVLLVLAGLSAALAWQQREQLRDYLRTRWRLLATQELVFLGFFLVFWLIRFGNPDLWHPAMGGEKPMDLAYLNAIIKSTSFPPYDPWFAGGYINYYYFGLLIAGTMIKLTGIVPWVAYNLVIPTFFALTATGACCVVFNLLPDSGDEDRWVPRALQWSLAGAALVAVVGNLGEVQLLWNGLRELGKNVAFSSTIPGLSELMKAVAGIGALLRGQHLPFRPEWWYWNASRIMTHGEINEFPFFTFLYADLHAHLTSLPFTLLVLGMATGCLRGVQRQHRNISTPDESASSGTESRAHEPQLGAGLSDLLTRWGRRLGQVDWPLLLQLALLGLAVGELWCTNTWDYPTYLGIALVALAIGVYAERGCVDLTGLLNLAWRAPLVVVLSRLFYYPYHARFGLAYSSVERWKGDRTSLDAYLIIWALPLLLLFSHLIALSFRPRARNAIVRAVRLFRTNAGRWGRAWHLYEILVRYQSLSYELAWMVLIVLGALWLLFLLAKAWVLLLAAPLLGLGTVAVLRSRASAEERFVGTLIAVGAALTAVVEYVVLKGDIGRMNTVFKFYLQVWVMWGIAAAVAWAYLARAVERWSIVGRQIWQTALTLLLVGAALYPLFASLGKVNDRWNPKLPPGLDGMQYMTTARYNDNNRDMVLENDRLAILWMQDHVIGSPVIAEATGPLYRWGNRFSIYTGLPTVIGWDWHQKQQRAAVSGEVVDWRQQDLRDLYNTSDIDLAMRLLNRYRVGYVIVGELERAYYDARGLDKFERMVGGALEVAYRRGPVTIYRVTAAGVRERTARTHNPGGIADWLARHWVPSSVKAEGPETAPAAPLMLDRPVEDLPVVSDRGWNRAAQDSTPLTVLCWLAMVEVLGLLAWPLCAVAMGPTGDAGYALAKTVGLLVVGYLVWIGASLRVVANSPPVAWGAVACLGVGALFFSYLGHGAPKPAASLGEVCAEAHSGPAQPFPSVGTRSLGPDLRLVALEECLFLLCFLAFVGIHILNPDLWQPWFGGEKMMEIAILNALSKSAYMPPYDPYFSGGYLNYYYYGHFLVNVITKLTGLIPEVAFNLAVPTFFSLTVSNSFWVGHRLMCGRGVPKSGTQPERDSGASPILAGLCAVGAVGLLANLSAVVQVLEGLARAGGAAFADYRVRWDDLVRVAVGFVRVLTGQATLPAFDYWYRATRIIPNTINEFPFFTFLFGDLHPHLIALPVTILTVAMSIAWLGDDRRTARILPIRWALLALVLGSLGPMNTWDLPSYAALLGLSRLYQGYRSGGVRGASRATFTFLMLVLTAAVLYAPFYVHYRPQHVGLALVPATDSSPLEHWLAIWGWQILLALSLEVSWLAQACPWRRLTRVFRRFGWVRTLARTLGTAGARVLLLPLGGLICLATCTLGVALAARGLAVVGLLSALLGMGTVALVTSKDSEAFAQRLLLWLGLGIILAVEIVYIRDFLSGAEWRRMNTVFKFYTQAWVMLGLAIGSALPGLWRQVRRLPMWGASLWQGAALMLLLSGALYVPLAITARVNERFPSGSPPRGTLSGMAYMSQATYTWPDPQHPIDMSHDKAAIEWLVQHVPGTPVIAEAALGFYREGGLRVSSYTGLPTILGAHEREQRPFGDVEPREADAALIYTTADEDEFRTLVQRYHVRYVYVGQLERHAYGDAGLAKFDSLVMAGELNPVYRNTGVVLYQVL